MAEKKFSLVATKVALLAAILGVSAVNSSYSHTSWHDTYIMHKCETCPDCCVTEHKEEPVDVACSFLMDLTAPHIVDTADWGERPGFTEPDQRICCVWDVEYMWCTTEEKPCSEWEYIEDGC